MNEIAEHGAAAGDEGSTLARAREAVARGAWAAAVGILMETVQPDGLSEDGLALLAEAAYPAGRMDLALDAWERLHAVHLRRGDRLAAAADASFVAMLLLDTGRIAPLRAWIKRAAGLLEGLPESPTHAWLKMVQAYAALVVGDLDEVLEQARQLTELGDRLDDPGSKAVGLNAQARALILQGHVDDGLELLDEAALAAVSGELSPMITAIIYCSTICASQSIADVRRAEEWTDAMERWRGGQAVGSFHGRCRVHRAELLRMRGSWSEAEGEAERASEELRPYVGIELGWPLAELGHLRLRRGDLVGAEEAFLQAHEAGWEPEPGLALLRLARGDVAAAANLIRDALDNPSQGISIEVPPNTELRRAPLLTAQVEIGLAAGDGDRAQWAAGELERVAENFGTVALRAAAATARGAIQLDAGDASAARSSYLRSVTLWREVEAPYDGARARLGLAQAYRALGNEDGAQLELRAAHAVFERLGAVLDTRRAEQLLALGHEPEPAGTRATNVFMFTDIVRSTDLIEVIGDEAWADLVGWHNRTLAELIATHRGEVIQTTGDGFFASFGTAKAALDSAVAIQRALDRHRREHGFAPRVRIGLHLAEATRRGGDWLGSGVHAAARIGALAGGGQILASQATLDADDHGYVTSESRTVSLKGISKAVQVATIEWR